MAIFLIYKKLCGVELNIQFVELKKIVSNPNSIYALLLVLVLQFVNWGLEAYKFRICLPNEIKISFKKILAAVYAGNATGFITPDRLGTFAGRKIVLRITNATAIFSTAIGNISQLITTILFGFIALIVFLNTENEISFDNTWALIAAIFSLILIIALMSGYLSIQKLRNWIVRRKRLDKYDDSTSFIKEKTIIDLSRILAFSLLRFITFSIQVYIVFYIFQIQLSIKDFIIFIGLLYLLTTVIPSPILGNLGTREALALLLLSSYSIELNIVLAILVIWVINVAFPAFLGSIILISKK